MKKYYLSVSIFLLIALIAACAAPAAEAPAAEADTAEADAADAAPAAADSGEPVAVARCALLFRMSGPGWIRTLLAPIPAIKSSTMCWKGSLFMMMT